MTEIEINNNKEASSKASKSNENNVSMSHPLEIDSLGSRITKIENEINSRNNNLQQSMKRVKFNTGSQSNENNEPKLDHDPNDK